MLKFQKIEAPEDIPWDLLLLADPSKTQIEGYIEGGLCYVAWLQDSIIGAIALKEIHPDTLEIKNIAVNQAHQGKGFGKQLLEFSTALAKLANYKKLRIGTGNSSIGQLALYQKVGFEIIALDKDFFLRNYTFPIIEHGITCKHMIILEKIIN